MQYHRECGEIWEIGQKNNHEILTEFQGDYTSLRQNLAAEEHFVI